jgi:NAD(P)-dependent dehydrogenase (short-subunit alcohol dehydrogenase family)
MRISNDCPVMLITGASSDLGFQITKKFNDLNFKIMAHFSSNSSHLIEIKNDHLELHQSDLRQPQAAKALVDLTLKRFGRLDILINMIGPFQESNLLEMNPEDWEMMLDLNLNVAYSVSHYATGSLIKTKGHILNFAYSGVDNLTGWPRATAYASAKAGLAVLTKSLAQALAPKLVRVNAVSPGWIDFGRFTPEKLNKIKEQTPMGRPGRPEEVVELVHWILTASPEFMTGALIPIGGGLEF